MPINLNRRSTPRPRGFTLVELIIAIVILGFTSLILIPFYQSTAHNPDPVIRRQAVALGQAIMDEILGRKWDHNTLSNPICSGESDATRPSIEDCALNATIPGLLGPESGETRATFNDIDDYAFYNLNPEVDTFLNQKGIGFTMPGFRRRVQISYIASNSNPINHLTPAAAGTTDTKLVVVSITSPLQETIYLVQVACNL
jgi:MSHA pilin protein MshD